MNEQNLKPFASVEEAREKGRKGGKSRSLKKRLAAQINGLKRKHDLSDSDVEKVLGVLESPELSALDIKERIDEVWNTPNMHPAIRNKILNTMISWHKAHHGTKNRIEEKHEIGPIRIVWVRPKKEEDGKSTDESIDR